MLYSELISRGNKRFGNFFCTLEPPLELIPDGRDGEEAKVISICGKIKIDTEKIKCSLLVTIVLHDLIETKPPIIYIRNFSAEKMQPNPTFSKLYEPVVAGVRVQEHVFGIEWSKYSSELLYNLMENINKSLQ